MTSISMKSSQCSHHAMENIRDIIVNDVRFSLAEISKCSLIFFLNQMNFRFFRFSLTDRVRLLFSIFFFSHTTDVSVRSIREANQKYILPRTHRCRRRWRRCKRIATINVIRVCILHQRMAATANSIQSSFAHWSSQSAVASVCSCIRCFFRSFWWMRVVSLTCTWMIEEHWPYYRKKNWASEPSVRRMHVKNGVCTEIDAHLRGRSAALIQNNNMNYENIAVDGNSDGRKMVFLWRRCQRAQHCGVSLMNENVAIRTSSSGCHYTNSRFRHRTSHPLTANDQSHAHITFPMESRSLQNRCRSNDELLQISFSHCPTSSWVRRA